jgi:hypothetical protein
MQAASRSATSTDAVVQDRIRRGTRELAALQRRLSRRALIRGAGTIAVAAPLLLPWRIPPEAFEIDLDGEPDLRPEAKLPPEEFVAHYRDTVRTRHIRLGCSFSPEYFGAAAVDGRPGADKTAMRALRAAVEDLGMADIRLGLRWDNLTPDGVQLTSFYRPYLDYCFSHPAVRTVALDIGPIKTFRWPEIHVPDAVLGRLRHVPKSNAEIAPDMELAQLSYVHVERVMEYLGREYDGAKSVAFSINEPFHGYGRFRWTMSEAYLDPLVDLVLDSGYFRGADLIVNSAQGLDLDRIAGYFEALVRRRPELHGRLVSGFDIYPFLPPVVDFPVLRQVLANVRRTVRDWDRPVAASLRRAHDPEYGYRIEVTEAQAEPFGQNAIVGNSLPHYQHVLAQCFDRILDPSQDESVVRIFGIEYQLQTVFDGTARDANRQILDLTRQLNALAG